MSKHSGIIIIAAMLGGISLGLLAASCGGGQPAMSYERIDERKHEIQLLWAQIRNWRQEAGLKGVEPPHSEIVKMHAEPATQAENICPEYGEPATPRCSDVCGIAEAICENADAICRIRSELPRDTWAQGKCWSAKASCKEARQECCQCKSGEQQR